MKVRVNCKFLPIDSKVTFPPNMKKFKKTTMVRCEGRSTWKVVEERVDANASIETSSLAEKVAQMCVFLQEPRITRDGTAYFCERDFDAEFDSCRIGTMNKKQRKIADECVEELNKSGDAACVCLKATRSHSINSSIYQRFGKMLCVLPVLFGQIVEGVQCIEAEVPSHLQMAEGMIDTYKPAVIVSFLDPGVEVSKAGKHYVQKLDDTAQKGGTVLCFAD
jgi:hypothetical protein